MDIKKKSSIYTNNEYRFDALLTFWCQKSSKWHKLTENKNEENYRKIRGKYGADDGI